MKKILKGELGIVSADAVIAITIVALFMGMIATVSYNIYLASTSTKRNAEATQYMIKIYETVDGMNYDDIDLEGNAVNGIIENLDAPSGYTITSNVSNYHPAGETEDLVKTVHLTIQYKIGNKQQTLEATHIKAKEI